MPSAHVMNEGRAVRGEGREKKMAKIKSAPQKPFEKLAKANPKKRRGKMNSLEAAYAEVLAVRELKGEVIWWIFEAMRFRLADETYYCPDFAVQLADGTIELHETKGRWMESARLRIKVAADRFPFRFVAIKNVKGKWEHEEFSNVENENE